MKLTKNQKIVLVIMTIVLLLIFYNMFLRKEHITNIKVYEKL
jgi:hypothetical protein